MNRESLATGSNLINCPFFVFMLIFGRSCNIRLQSVVIERYNQMKQKEKNIRKNYYRCMSEL